MMKKMMLMTLVMVLSISAHAMGFKSARTETFYLSDKMAHELSLTAEQYEVVYEINLDYLLRLKKADDMLGVAWERRSAAMQLVLSDWQYKKFLAIEYFYRPVKRVDDEWRFPVYEQYKEDKFYFSHPKAYKTYKGANKEQPASVYADRIVTKPANAKHNAAPAVYVRKPKVKYPDHPDDRFTDRIYDKPSAPANKPIEPIGTRKEKPFGIP